MRRVLKFNTKRDNSHNPISDILHVIMLFIIIVGGIVVFEHAVYAQISAANSPSSVRIQEGDEWYYFKGVQPPPKEWTSSGFNYGNWQKGPSGLGYGISGNRTYLGDMQGNYSTVFARKEFAVSNLQTVTGMTLSVVCDGPFIAYLNGIEIIRTNTIQVSSPDQINNSIQVEQFDISGFRHELFPRDNVLSIECSNDDINSSDFSFIPIFEVLESEKVLK